ncbi:hypothetical protein RND71_002593 [Anisodus tanguticus]|uniref:Uncharacterized protein n=1 Tax=Anisodus tanguticus TaxID=243964 RepID=A0AAE1T316_9SOLA|nr:hypothetical protein RND71_002593 [Anisodus tanguticus]
MDHHHQENSSKNMKGLQKDGGERERTASTRRFLVEDVNKLADDFINNFRKQLKFEREESFKQFQEMLNRGT